MSDAAESHLFVLWSAARSIEKRILDDIAENFEIVRTVEIRWSEEAFSENLTRFYGLLLPPGSSKETHVGTDPFLVVVVRDHAPRYAMEATSRGPAEVNATVFGAKARYREWTGGGHKVHATNSPQEFDHDLVLLLGRNAEDFENGDFPEFALDDGGSSLSVDLAGAEGWDSLRHLFYVLNSTTPYVVLRNFNVLPDAYYAGSHGDIDLMVRNFEETAYVAGATKVYAKDYRVHVKVKVGGDDVLFDFRFVGDGYYDRAWEERMLAEAVTTGDVVRVPSRDDYFFGLLYHALIHKKAVAQDYVRSFSELAPQGIVTSDGYLDVKTASTMLGSWLESNHFRICVPERSVQFNVRNALRTQRHMSRIRPALWPLSLVARPWSRLSLRPRRGMLRRSVDGLRRMVGQSARMILGEARWDRLKSRLRGSRTSS